MISSFKKEVFFNAGIVNLERYLNFVFAQNRLFDDAIFAIGYKQTEIVHFGWFYKFCGAIVALVSIDYRFQRKDYPAFLKDGV